MVFVQVIAFLAVLGVLAAYKVAGWIWIATIAILLLLGTLILQTPAALLIPAWILFATLSLLFTVTLVRLALLTRPVMRYLRSVLPPMRETEREAIQAGETWIEAQLFRGEPHWQEILNMPAGELSAEEARFLANETEQLCQLADDWRLTQGDAELEQQLWQHIRQCGFLGLIIPKQYGGKEFSVYANSAVVAKIASRSAGMAISVMVPNSLGPAEMLLHYGTEAQKNYYLPRLASGEDIPCFALTSLEAGSDATAIEDAGVVCLAQYEGKSTLGIKLSWNKRYITLAPIATVMGLAFQLSDPQGLLAGEEDLGITLALIPTSHPGVEIGRRHLPMNLPFMNGPITGNDVFIPIDWIIGGRDNVGKGWQMMMECLASGRGLSLPAVSTGISQLCYRTTGAYAHIRKQFNTPIGQFEGVAQALAQMAGYNYLLEAMRVFVLSGLAQGKRPAVLTAIAKYHMTEMVRVVGNHAMDVHGGRAIQCGPRNYLNFAYQALPISVTVEGANILTRNLIIFGQGAIRCHPYLSQELAILSDEHEQRPVEIFDKLFIQHMRYSLSNLACCLASSLTQGYFHNIPKSVKPDRAYYYRQVSRMSLALAAVSDVALALLGGELKRRENLSARLGDILSYLCLACAVLKYDNDHQQTEDHTDLVHWTLQDCLWKMQQALDEMLANFPHRIVAWSLRVLVFPLGRRYKAPADKHAHQLAEQMLTASDLRDELSHLCYRNHNTDDPIGRMEAAFALLMKVKPIDKKLSRAVREGYFPKHISLSERLKLAVQAAILSQEEVELYHQYEKLRKEAIAVDAFS